MSYDFMDEVDLPEPELSLGDEFYAAAHTKPIGRLAEGEHRDELAYVKLVERGDPPDDPKHYYYSLEGYAIDEPVLDKLREEGVELIFVIEKDTGDVIEYHIDDFNEEVDRGWYGGDPQLCAPEAESRRIWRDLGHDIYKNDGFWK